MIHQKSFSYADLELKKHFLLLLLLLLKTDVLYNNYLSGNCDTFSFLECFDGQQHLFEINLYFWKRKSTFLVIFDQFNAPLLNKSINFFPFLIYSPQTFDTSVVICLNNTL